MNGFIKLATYDDDKYGLISEFVNNNDEIVFAYTKTFNNKYTYMLVDDNINKELIEKYLKNE
ncbi:MAG: hypothetical protein IJ565_00575 [Bacilli bacterium]|nr:hypothetical protein [Bacilli bacterium]